MLEPRAFDEGFGSVFLARRQQHLAPVFRGSAHPHGVEGRRHRGGWLVCVRKLRETGGLLSACSKQGRSGLGWEMRLL